MAAHEEHVYEGAVGVEIAVLVKNQYTGQAMPLDGASVKKYRIRKPGTTTVIEWEVAFDNGVGDDGWLVYTSQEGDLTPSGRFLGEVYVEKGGYKLPTSWFDFWVHPVLEPTA